jgi:ribosomal protein L32
VGNDDQRRAGVSLSMIESVRCLECGEVYAKPAGGGTANANPGCPECGYVGWLSTAIPFRTASVRRHSGEDPPRRRSA